MYAKRTFCCTIIWTTSEWHFKFPLICLTFHFNPSILNYKSKLNKQTDITSANNTFLPPKDKSKLFFPHKQILTLTKLHINLLTVLQLSLVSDTADTPVPTPAPEAPLSPQDQSLSPALPSLGQPSRGERRGGETHRTACWEYHLCPWPRRTGAGARRSDRCLGWLLCPPPGVVPRSSRRAGRAAACSAAL